MNSELERVKSHNAYLQKHINDLESDNTPKQYWQGYHRGHRIGIVKGFVVSIVFFITVLGWWLGYF